MRTFRATIVRLWFTEVATNVGSRRIANLELSNGETIVGRPGGRANTAVDPTLVGKEFEFTLSRDGSFFDIDY